MNKEDLVIDIINDFYEMRLMTTSEFENKLLSCNKIDLVDFIIRMQCRERFKGIQGDEI